MDKNRKMSFGFPGVSSFGLPSWIFIVGILAFRSSFAEQYVIPSGSMEPTIQVGDHVWVNKAAYDLKLPFTQLSLQPLGEPAAGDVIVFRDPRNPSINLIKRLVAVPGDRVKVRDGIVTVNGRELLTSFKSQVIEGQMASSSGSFEYDETVGHTRHRVQRLPQLARHENLEVTVPAGQYFFLGDNRDNSADSRVWGFAPREALLGKAMGVLYSVRWKDWLPEPTLARSGMPMGVNADL